ncbi:MAG TPA: hypothetical protein VGZ02_02535 [Candidatus Baltobacteraceae bacterium]|jgi:hypothetical protein|nr:hypothetical protein [Candidatus Baltobacteraceae bacterium]
MKSYDSDEELERALFSLELEEPPADLRTSILSATIYRPVVPVNQWETWAVGAVCALLTWVAVILLRGEGAATLNAFNTHAGEAIAAFATPQMLFWAAAGGGLVLWISQLNLTLAPGSLRTTRR